MQFISLVQIKKMQALYCYQTVLVRSAILKIIFTCHLLLPHLFWGLLTGIAFIMMFLLALSIICMLKQIAKGILFR